MFDFCQMFDPHLAVEKPRMYGILPSTPPFRLDTQMYDRFGRGVPGPGPAVSGPGVSRSGSGSGRILKNLNPKESLRIL